MAGFKNVTRWAVVTAAWLNASGYNEIVATFPLKTEAETYARDTYGKRWRQTVSVVAVEALEQYPVKSDGKGRSRSPVKDSTHQTKQKECAEDGCTASFPDHKWGNIKATEEGWMVQKDGTAWCPAHLPHWVSGWRARQAKRDAKKAAKT